MAKLLGALCGVGFSASVSNAACTLAVISNHFANDCFEHDEDVADDDDEHSDDDNGGDDGGDHGHDDGEDGGDGSRIRFVQFVAQQRNIAVMIPSEVQNVGLRVRQNA